MDRRTKRAFFILAGPIATIALAGAAPVAIGVHPDSPPAALFGDEALGGNVSDPHSVECIDFRHGEIEVHGEEVHYHPDAGRMTAHPRTYVFPRDNFEAWVGRVDRIASSAADQRVFEIRVVETTRTHRAATGKGAHPVDGFVDVTIRAQILGLSDGACGESER